MGTTSDGARGRRRYVAAFEDGGERRDAWVRRLDDGRLEVGEATWGPLTKEVFGTFRHEHWIRLDTGGQQGPDLAPLGEDVLLCDLMDLLDAREVPYAYHATFGRDVVLRPGGVAL